jgi:glutamate synthase (NADPH/NADH) small chain
MGKPTGFLEYGRVEERKRPAAERIKDYREYALPPDADTLKTQAARCMDCGVPFCHAGIFIEGAGVGCPLRNLIPEINDLVYRGDVLGAYARLRRTNPFPEFTGRVCPAPCEGSCTLGEHEPPVTVRMIERYAADAAERAGVIPTAPAPLNGKKVAVVGSGPAGLACAFRLNERGYAVTVFERGDRAGGILTYGIPNMKLDKEVVARRVRMLTEAGVEFRLSVNVGTDYPAEELTRRFDAAVLCIGAQSERTISVAGGELEGVFTAMRYLTEATRSVLDKAHSVPAALSAHGKYAVIIGGGDTGTDCAATAIRQGALGVTQLEIMPELPLTRGADNPWPLWPRIKKTDYGQAEAAEKWGTDPRRYSTTVKEIIGAGAGNIGANAGAGAVSAGGIGTSAGAGAVSAVKTVRVEWKESDGRRIPVEVAGSEETIPAGIVITAMGFTGPEKPLIAALNLETDARGNIKADGHRTSNPKIFAAGDARRGPSLVVWAINEGLRAAEALDKAMQ